VENRLGTGGGEKLNEQADSESKKNSDSNLTNRASRDLIELWRSGSQDAARVLLARYEVRLVALVAARLNRRYRDAIAPEDIVQSAMGSFFRVTSAGTKPSIQLESTASAWNILATFTRRKLSRALERETALKRGGGWTRTAFDQLDRDLRTTPSAMEADDLLTDIHALLDPDQSILFELLLENATQREIGERLGVDARTVRRRITALRDLVTGQLDGNESKEPLPEHANKSIALPNITYRQFVLGKLVGSGALGKVYRARLQSDGQVVAVKFMHRNLWTNPISRLSFLREIDNASKINHPGILKYLGWGQSPHGGPYLVCEYVDGQSLANVNRENASYSVQWLIQICAAIMAAHQVGVVHGDLTPNNILLSQDGRIVVTDFGFATYTEQSPTAFEHDHSLASSGGTLGFAAPEQVSPAFGRISSATDIYAIGGLAYYLLTGRGPHDVSDNSLLDTVADEDVVISTLATTAAGSKLALVANLALRKGVNRRPQSVRELTTLLAD